MTADRWGDDQLFEEAAQLTRGLIALRDNDAPPAPNAGALLTADEASRLTLGVNVIVRQGDPDELLDEIADRAGRRWRDPTRFVAPQDWVALTGPCRYRMENAECVCGVLRGMDRGYSLGKCPDCRDGRRIVPLYTECPVCDADPDDGLIECSWADSSGGVPVGRGSIEVVPVVTPDTFTNRQPHITHARHGEKLWSLYRPTMGHYGGGAISGAFPDWHQTPLGVLDPEPVPGRDWGIVIDCVEVA